MKKLLAICLCFTMITLTSVSFSSDGASTTKHAVFEMDYNLDLNQEINHNVIKPASVEVNFTDVYLVTISDEVIKPLVYNENSAINRYNLEYHLFYRKYDSEVNRNTLKPNTLAFKFKDKNCMVRMLC